MKYTCKVCKGSWRSLKNKPEKKPLNCARCGSKYWNGIKLIWRIRWAISAFKSTPSYRHAVDEVENEQVL